MPSLGSDLELLARRPHFGNGKAPKASDHFFRVAEPLIAHVLATYHAAATSQEPEENQV